jgi:hypothetical protein
MNLATLNAHDWTPVLNKWGLWLADWTGDATGSTVNTTKTVVMLQYADGPTYDRDEWYGTVEQFKAYGWGNHNTQPTPTPPQEVPSEPTPTPDPVPTQPSEPATPPPTETPQPPADQGQEPAPVPTPNPTPETPTPSKVVIPEPTYFKLWELFVAIFKKLIGKK